MYVFVRYLRVFCVFCLTFHDFAGATVFRKVSLGVKMAKNVYFGVFGWRFSSGHCGSVSKKDAGCVRGQQLGENIFVWGWRFSSGHCESVSKKEAGCVRGQKLGENVFVCDYIFVYFAYFN